MTLLRKNIKTTHVSQAHDDNKIGLYTLTTLVIGNLVGSGAFVLPVALAAFGSICILGWITTTIGAVILSLIFAGLSARSSHSNGPHSFIEDQFGKTAGFFAAWSYWVLSWMSNAGLVVGAVGYLSPLFGGGLDLYVVLFMEIMLLLFLSFVNLLGIQYAGKLEIILTLCKVIPLVLLPFIGIFFIDPTNYSPFNALAQHPLLSINATAYLTLWCFIGIETGTVPGSDVINPQKTIPKAIILGTSIAAFIYIIGTLSIIGVVPKTELLISKAPYAELAKHIFGGSWNISIGCLASLACIGALNGWIMIVSRIAHGAAEDGVFPKIFKSTTKKGAPLWGTIISTLCTIPLMMLSLSESLLEQFKFILDFSLSLLLLIYIFCVLSYIKQLIHLKIFVLKRKILALSGLLFCFWTLAECPLPFLCYAIGITVLGYPMWWWVQKQQASKP